MIIEPNSSKEQVIEKSFIEMASFSDMAAALLENLDNAG